jgi:hypothetical protein
VESRGNATRLTTRGRRQLGGRPRDQGRSSDSCKSSRGENTVKDDSVPLQKAFFDSLNKPLHRIAARWRFLLNLKGRGVGGKR